MNAPLDEIARLTKFAEAEAAFALVAPEAENPWAGSAARLAAAKESHEAAIVRARGERLLQLIADYRIFSTELDGADIKVRELNAEQNELAKTPLLKRWRDAPALSRALAQRRESNDADVLPHYAEWFKSGRSADHRRAFEVPDPRWPPALRFNDADREAIIKYFSLGAALEQAYQSATGLRHIIDTMLRDAPELAAVQVERAELAATA